MDLSDA